MPRSDERHHFDEVAAYRAYAEISGLMVGFVVTALTVVFTIAQGDPSRRLGSVVVLLALGLVCGAAAALTFSTVSAYSNISDRRVGHLLLVAPAVCALAVLAALETLAVIFLPYVADFLAVTHACLAGLVVVPAIAGLRWPWKHRLITVACVWGLIVLALAERLYVQWWSTVGGLAVIVMIISVGVAALTAVAYVHVSDPRLAKRLFRWGPDTERLVATAVLTVFSVVLIAALAPPT
jgi:hypothetical protein